MPPAYAATQKAMSAAAGRSAYLAEGAEAFKGGQRPRSPLGRKNPLHAPLLALTFPSLIGGGDLIKESLSL